MAGFLSGVAMWVHFAALLYVGLGGFLAWRWPKAIFVHVVIACWSVAINVFGWACPFTAAEDHFRAQQGLGPLPGGFNEYYIYDDLIPRSMLPVVMVVAVLVLVASYVGVYLRWRQRRPTPVAR